MDMSTISLCMIVRDEEDNLARCLESVCGFVNEIIIVDTGSRDATPAIAKHYGAQICHLPWQDDFSQARNESLQQAIGEWVLVLDADEELPQETAHNLRRLASCRHVEAWTFSIISPCHAKEAGQRIRHPGLRMFKNREVYCFEGRIHEQIRPSILRANPTAVIQHSDAEIMHYGYKQNTGQRREKTLRNISILKQALAEKPGDLFLNYNLGLSFYALGDLENSRRHYESVRPHLNPEDRFTAAFFRNYAICLADLGDFEQALNLINDGLACFPDYPDLYFIKGELLFDLNLMTQAKNNFLKCLHFQTLPQYVTTEGVTGHLALQNLAEVCTRQQELDAAVSYLEQTLRIRPSYELFAQLCSLKKQKGLDERELATYLENSFHLDHREIARLLLDIKEAGYHQADIQQLEDALRNSIATAGVYYLLGTACANLGRPGQAFVYFAQAGLQEPGNELYATCALEQLASQCLLHIVRMLDLENGPVELRKEMFRLTSLKHKAQQLKQDLLASDTGGKKLEAGAR
jgi:glycosyltransferase involved in cell wall biosynthesis